MRLCTGHTAHRGSRGIALPFLNHGTRRGWGVSVTPRPLFTTGKDPVPIVQEAEWAPGPVWTGVENLSPGFDPRTVQPVASPSKHEFRENRLIDSHVLFNGVNEFISVLITSLGQFGWNSLQDMCTSFCGAFLRFLKIGGWKFVHVLFVWVHMKSHWCVYRELIWHFVRK